MKPRKYNMECWQGKTFDEPFYFMDEYENIIDLSGYTGRMQVRTAIDATDVAIELTTANGRVIIDPSEGLVRLFIAPTDTALLAAGSYKYDLELITASGRVYGPLYGSFKVKAEVTR
jgi:hypothetical protein